MVPFRSKLVPRNASAPKSFLVRGHDETVNTDEHQVGRRRSPYRSVPVQNMKLLSCFGVRGRWQTFTGPSVFDPPFQTVLDERIETHTHTRTHISHPSKRFALFVLKGRIFTIDHEPLLKNGYIPTSGPMFRGTIPPVFLSPLLCST